MMLASDKQVHWIKTIGSQHTLTEGAVKTIVAKVINGEPVDRSEASTALDYLFSLPRTPRAAAAPVAPVEPGMYRVNGVVFRVQRSRTSGGVYAKRLSGSKDTGFGFEYVGSTKANGITPEHRMTKDEAVKFGMDTGTCCVCAAVLTDPKSIAAGIGPVCGGRV